MALGYRARSGCKKCKERHLKCDEVRPVCSRCTLSAAECNYAITLVWEDDSVSAGKSHGRAGTWSKAQADGQTSRYSNGQSLPPPTQSQQFLYGTCAGAFLNTTASDIQNWLSQTQNSGRQWASIPAQIASAAVKIGHSASSASCFSSLCDNISLRSVETDKMLLDYYHSVVSVDETLVRPDDENDPRQYIFLQALSSPAVALGILMVTAHLWSQTDANISALASEYRKLVLEVVKKSSDPGDMMLLAVMLCSMELTCERGSVWMVHFTLFRDIIQERQGLSETGYVYDYIYRLCCRYLVCHLVIAKTVFPVEEVLVQHMFTWSQESNTSERSPSSDCSLNSAGSSWTSTENLSLIMDEETLDQIDPYSGLSNSLLLLINDISDLEREVQSLVQDTLLSAGFKEEAATQLMVKAQRLVLSLSNLKQFVSPGIERSDPRVAEDLRSTAEAGRLAALTLLHETMHNSWTQAQSGSTNQSSNVLSRQARGAEQVAKVEERKAYIEKILDLVGELLTRPTKLNVSWPLWALFIAGSSLDDDQNRLVVIRLFRLAMEKSTFGNILPAFQALQALWKQRDLAADEGVSDRTIRRRRQHGLSRLSTSKEVDTYRGWGERGRVMAMQGYLVSLA